MRRFIKNLLLFIIPLVVYLGIILVVDPYNFLNISKLVNDSTKWEISRAVSPHMYRMLDFKNHPLRNITLGDSRTLRLEHVMDDSRWKSMGFEGASIKEMTQVFWWAIERSEIDTVIIGINLSLYNKYNKRFWVEETIEAQKNFLSYAFNKSVFRATYLIAKSVFSKEEVQINKTDLNKEEFWQQQLRTIPEKYFSQFSYPDNYYRDLKEISVYCAENGIALVFWIPPTHIDFQKRIEMYDIEEARMQFIEDLKGLGGVYDYNYPNELTTERDKFSDPLHFTLDIAVLIRDQLTAGKPYLGRYYSPSSTPKVQLLNENN